MVNQKEGVYAITMGVLAEAGIELEGQAILSIENVASIKKRVTEVAAMQLMAGEIDLSAEARVKYSTIEKMKSYASGLVNNWFRKDTRLNGGDKYVAKNPGSRQGIGDSQLKNLKALRELKKGDATAIAAIDEAIELRKLEIEDSKAKKVVVDYDKIPDDLKAKLGI